MNVPEYIKLAKNILNEGAGSEGLEYTIEAKSGLKAIENDLFKIEDIKTENGITVGKLKFGYPHDYGFALQTVKDHLGDIELVALKLVY